MLIAFVDASFQVVSVIFVSLYTQTISEVGP